MIKMETVRLRTRWSILFHALGLLVLFSCNSVRKFNQQSYQFTQAVKISWQKDSCGYYDGDRAAIARIFNRYSSIAKNNIDEGFILELFGQPDEIRKFSASNIHWYYFIGGNGDCHQAEVSKFILDIGTNPRRHYVSGSSIHLWEPEDN